jgi:hypothetical protein
MYDLVSPRIAFWFASDNRVYMEEVIKTAYFQLNRSVFHYKYILARIVVNSKHSLLFRYSIADSAIQNYSFYITKNNFNKI